MSVIETTTLHTQEKTNVTPYAMLTNDGKHPLFIHLKSQKTYYVRDVKLDCTNSRGGHEAGRYMVEYGPVETGLYTSTKQSTPYVRDLDEFLTAFIPVAATTQRSLQSELLQYYNNAISKHTSQNSD